MNSSIEHIEHLDQVEPIEPIEPINKPKKIYDYKKYMAEYIKKHREDKIECPDCKKIYSIFNKSHHKKSVYHRKTIEYLNKKNETL